MDTQQRAVIALTGLAGRGYHGVLADERQTGQEFIVDLELVVDMPSADEITETVDYGELATTVVGIVEGEPVNLIETLADRIVSAVLKDQRVQSVTVTVHKPQAPITVRFDDVAVMISRSKHD